MSSYRDEDKGAARLGADVAIVLGLCDVRGRAVARFLAESVWMMRGRAQKGG